MNNEALVTAALLFPMVQYAAGQNWLPVLIMSTIALLLQNKERVVSTKWIRFMRSVILILVMAGVLRRSAECLPGEYASIVVPIVLTVLAIITCTKKKEEASAAVSIQRIGISFLLGIILLAGLQENTLGNFKTPTKGLRGELMALMLLPQGNTERRKRIGLYTIPTITAIITGGCELYAYTRGISIGAVAERMESLVSCASVLGGYAIISYLIMKTKEESGKNEIVTGLAALLIVWSQIRIAYWMIVGAQVLLWHILPDFTEWKNKRKKFEKSA